MDGNKSVRPEGTDGADFKKRHVVEERFIAAAKARLNLGNQLRFFVLTLAAGVGYFLLNPLCFEKENTFETRPFMWFVAVYFLIVYGIAQKGLQDKNNMLIRAFQILCVIGDVVIAYGLYVEMMGPPTLFGPSSIMAIFLSISIGAIRASFEFLHNSGENIIKKSK